MRETDEKLWSGKKTQWDAENEGARAHPCSKSYSSALRDTPNSTVSFISFWPGGPSWLRPRAAYPVQQLVEVTKP